MTFEHPFSYGDKVVFKLPTAMRLDFKKGKWIYTPISEKTYTGTVEVVKRYQLTVNVSGKGLCKVHPDMCQFRNIAMSKLQARKEENS